MLSPHTLGQLRRVRMVVGCINWGIPDAPHAVAYALIDGEARGDRFFATWAEAIAWADSRARYYAAVVRDQDHHLRDTTPEGT